jgi:multidrug transporter EmrE-like cation transporter
MTTNQYSPLFRLATKSLKYFLWVLFGFAIAYALSSALGMLHLIPILMYFLKHFFTPFAIILLCLMTTAIIFESVR